ncbi:hypothetical protein GGH92_009555, partial [Coemansia sp. RSA 2673]
MTRLTHLHMPGGGGCLRLGPDFRSALARAPTGPTLRKCRAGARRRPSAGASHTCLAAVTGVRRIQMHHVSTPKAVEIRAPPPYLLGARGSMTERVWHIR